MISFLTAGNAQTVADNNKVRYENPKHKLAAQVLKSWTLSKEFENMSKSVFIVQWLLPKVYSEIEKTDIANAVSVTCLYKPSIKNVDALAAYEFSRVSDVLVKKEKLSDQNNAYLVYSKIDGLSYKSKYYFTYLNGIGYVINFTATEGTYDKNLKGFDNFFRDLTITE